MVPRVMHSLCISITISVLSLFVIANDERKIYIVYMGSLPSNQNYYAKEHHLSMLQDVTKESNVTQYHIRSATKSFNAFSAHLTDEEAKLLSANAEVVSVFPSKTYQLQTTESWNFIGLLPTGPQTGVESEIVIGVFDSGIWPESRSFNDVGFDPIPEKWKGECLGGQDFTCNRKIIGARSYIKNESCRDMSGHGSHVASIAAGNIVEDASFFGIAQGTARGGVPAARIAVYKVCTAHSCAEENFITAFDDAIADGVDIISVSVSSKEPMILNMDFIAVGSFHAAERGILTVHAAGNDGPNQASISSNPPWLFSVAASTIDREFVTNVGLGTGVALIPGHSVINSYDLHGTQFPVRYGADASNNSCDSFGARNCNPGCIDRTIAKGNILMCDSWNIDEVYRTGALGLIVKTPDFADLPIVAPFPISKLDVEQYALAQNYYNSSRLPNMNIVKTGAAKNGQVPVVASFSSRGPNLIVPDILKPDITAPGVGILAAFSPEGPISQYTYMDKRSVSYNIMSGTSMACPHVTGAAAFLKSVRTDWSPSAIKSALMTTASQVKNVNGGEENEFAYGTGHIDPLKAAFPGILYQIAPEDYVKMLCAMNITSYAAISKMSEFNITCDGVGIQQRHLNYPSMAAKVDVTDGEFMIDFRRTVTNVNHSNSVYKATITCNHPPCSNITVEPDTLSFTALGEQQSFVVTVAGHGEEFENTKFMSASLEWSDGFYIARSPIVIYV